MEAAGEEFQTFYKLDQYAHLNEKLKASTNKLLEANWKKVKDKCVRDTAVPTAEMVDKSFLKLEHLVAALERVCDYRKQAAKLKKADSGEESLRVTVGNLSRAPELKPPPESECCKKKAKFDLWPEYYVKIESNGRKEMGLYVYETRDDAEPRKTSIPSLRGCEVIKGVKKFNLSRGKWRMLTIKGEALDEHNATEVHFLFGTENDVMRDKFYDACTNLSAGRPWNKSEAEHADDEKKVKEHNHLVRTLSDAGLDDAPEPQPEPEATDDLAFDHPGTTVSEYDALIAGEGESHNTGLLLDICSKVFLDFYSSLKANADTISTETIKDEVRAEAFRLWAMQLVRTQTSRQVEAVETELTGRFFDTASATGPFSATAIYGNVGLPKMIQEHEAYAASKKSPRGGPPGPAQLLQMGRGEKERARKEQQQRTLKTICAKFAASGLDF